jgi:predicted transcriptional regulator
MPSAGTTRRTVRVDDDLWLRALVTAYRRGDNLPDVIRDALERYVDRRDKRDKPTRRR